MAIDIEMREAIHELMDEALDAIDATAEGGEDPDEGAYLLYTTLVGVVHAGPGTDNQEQYETAWNHFYGVGLRVLTEGTVQ